MERNFYFLNEERQVAALCGPFYWDTTEHNEHTDGFIHSLVHCTLLYLSPEGLFWMLMFWNLEYCWALAIRLKLRVFMKLVLWQCNMHRLPWRDSWKMNLVANLNLAQEKWVIYCRLLQTVEWGRHCTHLPNSGGFLWPWCYSIFVITAGFKKKNVIPATGKLANALHDLEEEALTVCLFVCAGQ